MQNSFDREDLQAPLAEINTTPLVDVMLVLLVIFLVTAPMLNSAIKLNLPTESAAQISEEKTITISIDGAGQYYLDDEILPISEIEKRLKIAAQKDANQHVHLRADVDVKYGKVSSILASLQNIGISNIGFVTEPK
jgi:biopolymer transport protein ExbD